MKTLKFREGLAKITHVKKTTFGNLTEEDKKGHEMFSSDDDMHKHYSKLYGFKVKPKTKVKIIRFKLVD